MMTLANTIRLRAPYVYAPEHRKSLELLLSCLSPKQREILERWGYIEVRCPGGIFRVYCGYTSENIIQLHPRTRRPMTTWCILPKYGHSVAVWDLFLIQVLVLKTQYMVFRTTACHFAFVPICRAGGRIWGYP